MQISTYTAPFLRPLTIAKIGWYETGDESKWLISVERLILNFSRIQQINIYGKVLR